MTTASLESVQAKVISPAKEHFEIRLATEADNQSLLELTRATPMAGVIALRIDRDPDFLALLRARGVPLVLVVTSDGNIVGCMSAAVQMAYIHGQLEKIAHVGDLKVHPQFRGMGLSMMLVNALEQHLRNAGVDLSFCLVADGNNRVMPLSEGKHGTTPAIKLGRFIVDQILPTPFRGPRSQYQIEAAHHADLTTVAIMLDQASRDRQFAPEITAGHLAEFLHDSTHFATTLVARDQGKIVATLTLEDTSHLRQNILMGAPAHLRLALPILRILALPIRGIAVPRVGHPLTMLYVRHPACLDGHEPALRALISAARQKAFAHRYTFLSVGLHERDPLRKAVTGFPAFTFHSLAMAANVLTQDRVNMLQSEIPYEDFALV